MALYIPQSILHLRGFCMSGRTLLDPTTYMIACSQFTGILFTTSNREPRPNADLLWRLPLTNEVTFHPTPMPNETHGTTPNYQFWFYQATSKTLKMGWWKKNISRAFSRDPSQSLKCQEIFTTWCGCLSEKISVEGIFYVDLKYEDLMWVWTGHIWIRSGSRDGLLWEK